MTNRDFGQLVLGHEAPSLEKRENVVRNGLRDWSYQGSYIRAHAVKATSKSAVYAAVSYEKNGIRFLTYAVASLKCSRKDDGHWLSVECFLTNTATPFTLTDCPDEVFAAGQATGLTAQVDSSWYSQCMQSRKVKANIEALKKGQIFVLDSTSHSTEITGEKATYAIALSKKTARFISPFAGKIHDADAIELLQHYTPIPHHQVPAFTETDSYTEVGELLFDLSGFVPTLKGRLAAGAKAALITKARKELDRKFNVAVMQFDFGGKFTSGAWLS